MAAIVPASKMALRMKKLPVRKAAERNPDNAQVVALVTSNPTGVDGPPQQATTAAATTATTATTENHSKERGISAAADGQSGAIVSCALAVCTSSANSGKSDVQHANYCATRTNHQEALDTSAAASKQHRRTETPVVNNYEAFTGETYGCSNAG